MFSLCVVFLVQGNWEPCFCCCFSAGELGELAGKIVKGNPVREFDGYVNKAATQKKILHDVFRKGDTAFMTGDNKRVGLN